ncbi:Sulfotransferase family protein [Rhizobiales bacterium GAS191]|nr:Sulfotransferase family protein [Rhizobiales bacterium GAS113]SEC08505.1 Sulfotransferase family protein [Rhizobiales bacterium GAS191]
MTDTIGNPPRVMDQRPAHRRRYGLHHFRISHGMVASAWFRLLVRNHFAVSPSRIPFALQVSIYSVLNSVLRLVQTLLLGRRIARLELAARPIFIIGHWRTGTTLLHELLALDERFLAPSTLECFAPAHFLVTGRLLRMLAWFLPATRPMDDMAVGWDRPQEDEFALLNLGFGSPYETLIFPNHRPVGIEFLNMSEMTPEQVEAWKAGLSCFLKQVQFRSDRESRCPPQARRLVLKSPPHTARLHILRPLFPGAQFVHIVRHPFDVFASTVRLWRAMSETQGCQAPRQGQLPNGAPSIEDYVLHVMELLYRDFVDQVAQLPRENICEVRYEDLVRAPIAEVRRIYQHLGLDTFEPVRPRLEAHLASLGDYTPNDCSISEDHKAEVSRRWRWYMERYNYGFDRQ